MSLRVIQDSEAAFEFQEAVAWYENQAEGLGVRFTLEVDAVMLAITCQPLRFPKAGRKTRKARIHGWPYSIYFVVNEVHAEIKVVAVWHGARNPAELRSRLK
jgi:plasmid stabilization system protein ParE